MVEPPLVGLDQDLAGRDLDDIIREIHALDREIEAILNAEREAAVAQPARPFLRDLIAIGYVVIITYYIYLLYLKYQ